MTLKQINLPPARESIIRAAERLPINELTNLVQDLLNLQARRQSAILPQREADLLQLINQGLTADQQTLYEQLIEKRLAETLTVVEHQELQQINQQVEQLNLTRIKNLVSLAQLRQTTLPELMTELGIAEPHYIA